MGLAAGIGMLIAAGPAHGELRLAYDDATVMQRSNLIVIGRIQRGSITYVLHKRKKPYQGRSWEHHAVLVIDQVLKGTLKKQTLPIVIHYGLTPVVGGHVARKEFSIDLRSLRKNYPKEIIEILDTGSSGVSFTPLVKDAGKDNIWFLRKGLPGLGGRTSAGKHGIRDPEDVRPLALKDYFLAYLAPNPENAIRAYLKLHPDMIQGRRFLDHMEVRRILKIKDLRRRARRLVFYFKRRHTWNSQPEAREALGGCGQAAGPELVRLFSDPLHQRLREDIMNVWGRIRFRGAVPILIGLLAGHDRFWASQKLERNWWNSDAGSASNRKRRRIYGETYSAVIALQRTGDRRARAILKRTLKRWRAIAFSNPQIVEACASALARM